MSGFIVEYSTRFIIYIQERNFKGKNWFKKYAVVLNWYILLYYKHCFELGVFLLVMNCTVLWL
jgi:hypothetical protein